MRIRRRGAGGAGPDPARGSVLCIRSIGSVLSHQSRLSVLSHQSDVAVLSSQSRRAIRGYRQG